MKETSLQEIVGYLLDALRYEWIVDENGTERDSGIEKKEERRIIQRGIG